MKRILTLAMAAFLVMGITGCSSLDSVSGTKISDDQLASFTKGKTTKDEVTAKLGGPQDIRLEGGKQILVYKYQRIAAMPWTKNDSYTTTFIFDDKGVLQELLKSNSTISVPLAQ